MTDLYNLQRFVDAQNGIYDRVIEELRAGRKRSHWMWFIFPQILGLGSSATSQRYALTSTEEALAYWLHPILGPRLRECLQCVVTLEHCTAADLFAYPDCLKFHSCLTLFEQSISDDPLLHQALLKYFNGTLDQATLAILNKCKPPAT